MLMVEDMLVDSFSDGALHVKTLITPSSKVYYLVTVGYFSNGVWVNQSFTILESELSKLLCLLRRALLFPKKSYAQLGSK